MLCLACVLLSLDISHFLKITKSMHLNEWRLVFICKPIAGHPAFSVSKVQSLQTSLQSGNEDSQLSAAIEMNQVWFKEFLTMLMYVVECKLLFGMCKAHF